MAEVAQPAWLSFVTAMLPVMTAVGGGIWAVVTWRAQRRDEAEKARAVETQRLDQQATEERNRRDDRAAEFVAAFGAAQGRQATVAAAMALTLYPDETLPVLVNALGYLDDNVVDGAEVAVVAVGVAAIPVLVRYNRLARLVAEPHVADAQAGPERPPTGFHVAQLLRRTRDAIVLILLQCSHEDIAEVDLADADLSSAAFRAANLRRANFRKARLDDSDFSGCRLVGSSFRGASLGAALFREAALDRADFTGATGRPRLLSAHGDQVCLDRAELDGASLTGAKLPNASLTGTRLRGADLRGAHLTDARLSRTDLWQARADECRLTGAVADDVRLDGASLVEARLDGARITESRLRGTDLGRAQAASAVFDRCDLGGANAEGAVLTGATFTACNLGGAVMSGGRLAGATFDSCNLGSTVFDGADLMGVTFRGTTQFTPDRTSFAGANWADATFAEGSEPLRAWLSGTG